MHYVYAIDFGSFTKVGETCNKEGRVKQVASKVKVKALRTFFTETKDLEDAESIEYNVKKKLSGLEVRGYPIKSELFAVDFESMVDLIIEVRDTDKRDKTVNSRGAGRKSLPYKSQILRVPEPVIEEVKAIIKSFKEQQKQGA